MTAQPEPKNGTASSAWRSVVITTTITLAMLAWSWQTWPDPLVDFGTQLYVPWQMTTGKVIYRDFAYYNGPLSQYIHAGLFAVFGVSIRTIAMANLVVLVGVLILIHQLARRAAGPVSATLCCVTFILLFAFGQGAGVGNFNWLTPYTNEITHGIALGLLSITLSLRYQKSGKRRWLLSAGATAGLVFLTKTEPFVSTLAASLAVLIAGAWVRRQSFWLLAIEVVFFACALVVMPLVAFGLMSLQMPATTAARGVLGSWPWVFDRRVTALPFYRRISGTDNVPANLLAMVRWSLIYAGAIGIALLLGLRSRRPGRAVPVILFLAPCFAMGLFYDSVDWGSIVRPLPLCLVILLVLAAVPIVRRLESSPVERSLARVGLVVFAIVQVSKIALNTGIPHYGFALSMPGVLMLTAFLFEILPGWIRSRGGSAAPARAIAAAGWVAAVVVTLSVDQMFFATRQWTIGADRDQIRVDRRGVEIGCVVEQVKRLVPANGMLVVLPQGLMVNYLARRASAIPYINFMPPEVLAVGEDQILNALATHPPDAVVIDAGSVDGDCFTMDQDYRYGAKTLAWVRDHYKPVTPVKPNSLVLFRRN